MANTQNSAAIDLANQCAALMVSAQALYRSALNLQTRLTTFNANAGVEHTWQQFPTAAQNADGTLGTPDASPVQTNPMDTRTTQLAGLNIAATYANYAAAQTEIAAIITALGGTSAVAAYQPFNQGT
jgi:hypothetical protein